MQRRRAVPAIERRWPVAATAAGVLILAAGCGGGAGGAVEPPVAPSPSIGTSGTSTEISSLDQPSPDATFDGTGTEWRAAIVTCLLEDGWDVNLSTDGSEIEARTTIEQDAEWVAAQNSCMAQVGTIPIHHLDEQELAALYAHELLTRECLARLGYPSNDPPSESEYIDRYYEGGWTAYEVLPADLPEADWAEANRECPQVPEGAEDW